MIETDNKGWEIKMKAKAFRAAFPYTVPVFMGYLFLGIAFGVLLASKGYHAVWAAAMSLTCYAGSGQFVAVNLLAAPFAPLHAVLIELMVNCRHLFYGLSLLEPFSRTGRLKPYMVFSLTDETYSLQCGVVPPDGVDEGWFRFFISVLDHSYWIFGSVVGALAGTLIPFDSTGIDFAMTALFTVIFVEQWESGGSHLPALTGLGVTATCLLLFGSENFIPFALLGIAAILLASRKRLEVHA